MKIVDYQGSEISTLQEWERHFNSPKHWKKGRSAYSLADFILNSNGAASLESRVSSVLSDEVIFERATPEYLAKFDSYRSPSHLDLGIIGKVGPGKNLFVGVEAKVDEVFGKTVSERYQDALNTRQSNPRTKAPERVEQLLSKYFSESAPPDKSRFSGIRYQLLTAVAGTVAVPKDVVVLCVLVFKTNSYDPQKGVENYRDYERFLDCAGGKSLAQGGQVSLAHEFTLNGKRLVCIHESVNFGI